MTASSQVQGNGPLVGLVFLSSKSSSLGLFAGDSITCVSPFSWMCLLLRHSCFPGSHRCKHAGCFYSRALAGTPGGDLCPPCCSAWFMPVSHMLHAANFSSERFTGKSKGWASPRCHTTFLCSPEMGKIQHETHPLAPYVLHGMALQLHRRSSCPLLCYI